MMLDYNSLLSALGVSSVCLLLTLSGTWLGRRDPSFLFSWVVGLGVCVAGIISYSFFISAPTALVGAMAMIFMQWGSCILYGAAEQFRTDRFPLLRVVSAASLASVSITTAFLTDYWGLGFILLNLGATVAFLATAHQYWLAKSESPGILTGITLLYGVVAVSFFPCAMTLIQNGSWVLHTAPSGLAEDVNIAFCIAGMTGIGGLSLTAHQARITAQHRLEAMTDSLTGLSNRRALFETYKHRRFRDHMAILVFDIDRFKSINDQYGHAVGDQIIQTVARELQAAAGVDIAARLGGEEFAAVVEDAMPGRAEWIGERIRKQLQEREIVIEGESLRVTTSVGICYGTPSGLTFDEILKHADDALYCAKRMGRNRVEVTSLPVPTAAALNRA
ncbi:MAG TPA: GGDEF domain-containing protein [Rhizobium sp.]|nr:GGDEF domain-containing protein [Rhizobium sp.]